MIARVGADVVAAIAPRPAPAAGANRPVADDAPAKAAELRVGESQGYRE